MSYRQRAKWLPKAYIKLKFRNGKLNLWCLGMHAWMKHVHTHENDHCNNQDTGYVWGVIIMGPRREASREIGKFMFLTFWLHHTFDWCGSLYFYSKLISQ